jgi:hypothetical protein
MPYLAKFLQNERTKSLIFLKRPKVELLAVCVDSCPSVGESEIDVVQRV